MCETYNLDLLSKSRFNPLFERICCNYLQLIILAAISRVAQPACIPATKELLLRMF